MANCKNRNKSFNGALGTLGTLSTILCKRIMKHNHISQPRPHRISSFPRIRLQFG